jgi:GDPmannose 4,6-dehydratase
MAPNDFRSVLQTLAKVEPDELYNLAGQSSVGLSFQQPVETLESISVGTLNLLEAMRFLERPIRFCNASSGKCFGDQPGDFVIVTGQTHTLEEFTPLLLPAWVSIGTNTS